MDDQSWDLPKLLKMHLQESEKLNVGGSLAPRTLFSPFFGKSPFTNTFTLYFSLPFGSNTFSLKYFLLEDLNVLQEHYEQDEDPK